MGNVNHSGFGLKERDLDTIREIFNRYPEVKEVHVFGSRAKGTYKTGSDIDLAIINTGVSDKTMQRLYDDFQESRLPYTIDLVCFHALNHLELADHIRRYGIEIYSVTNK